MAYRILYDDINYCFNSIMHIFNTPFELESGNKNYIWKQTSNFGEKPD